MPINKNIKEVMRDNAINLVEILLLEKQEFRVVLWTEQCDFSNGLPKDIKDSFSTQLPLDIKDQALEDSWVDEDTGEITLGVMFGDELTELKLQDSQIIAILDLAGQPFIINNFEPDEPKKPVMKPKTKVELLNSLKDYGIKEEDLDRSVQAFMKFNPDILKG